MLDRSWEFLQDFLFKQALSILISYKQLSVNKHRVLCDRHETADDGLARDRSINQLAVSRLQSGAN